MSVSADGTGVVSHVGTRLLAEVAVAAGLPEAFDEAAGVCRWRRSAHAPGRVLTDLAVLRLMVVRRSPILRCCGTSLAAFTTEPRDSSQALTL